MLFGKGVSSMLAEVLINAFYKLYFVHFCALKCGCLAVLFFPIILILETSEISAFV